MTQTTHSNAPASAPSITFAELKLIPELMKALEAEGYTTPTPIQAKAIPSVLEGRDLLGIAQTGTGKTAAFALPILQRLLADRKPAARKGCRALILSPTRELASQIADSFKTYGRFTGLRSGVIFGGVGYKPQINLLSGGVDVLVGTPGRLIDLMQEGHLVLGSTEILVLDEADQMMDLGFIRPLRQIVAKLAHKRQSLFFSATMPHEIGALAAELLRDPVQVSVAPVSKTADRVTQQVIHIEASKKRALLVELMASADLSRVLVFTRTKRGADKVARHLEGAGINAAAIHGNKSQNQREAALDGFKRGKIRVLVATDIAARGIDVDLVTHVINFELPNIPESYVHRIGRTARAGAEGIAISLVDGEERAYLRDIEKLTRQQIPAEDRRGDATLVATATVEDRPHRDPRAGRGGPGGRRPDARTNASRPMRPNGDRPRGDAPRGDGPRGERSAPRAGHANGHSADQAERRPYDPMAAVSRPAQRPHEPGGVRADRVAGRSGASQAPRSGASQAPRSGASQAPRSGASQAPRSGASQAPRSGASQAPRFGASQDARSGASQDRRDQAAARPASAGPRPTRSRFDEERASHQARPAAGPTAGRGGAGSGRPNGGFAVRRSGGPSGGSTGGGRSDH